MLPSSCADVKNFLSRSAARTVMGALNQLNPSPLFPQGPRGPGIPEICHNVSKLVSIPFPSKVTFYAALKTS